jgi:hypothetical protein
VMPESSLRPAAEVLGPTGKVVANAVAGAAGKDAVVISAPLSLAGAYQIVVRGLANTTGKFTAELNLNAALEREFFGGPTNDTLQTAQALTVPLSSPPSPIKVQASVLAQLQPGDSVGDVWVLGHSPPTSGGYLERYDNFGNLIAEIKSPALNHRGRSGRSSSARPATSTWATTSPLRASAARSCASPHPAGCSPLSPCRLIHSVRPPSTIPSASTSPMTGHCGCRRATRGTSFTSTAQARSWPPTMLPTRPTASCGTPPSAPMARSSSPIST